jgi:hypothetical protein
MQNEHDTALRRNSSLGLSIFMLICEGFQCNYFMENHPARAALIHMAGQTITKLIGDRRSFMHPPPQKKKAPRKRTE